ncbi:MAG: hypothetical protein KGZ65_04020 [Sphingomonadales bacterium]|nr:hypothetical protein [Sphingomonadaceae bacterium]MBS3930379.1 hypothetical protein [Sphingomonadales bacterium]
MKGFTHETPRQGATNVWLTPHIGNGRLNQEQAIERFLPRYKLLDEWTGFDKQHRFLDTATGRVVTKSGYSARSSRKWKGRWAMIREKIWHGCSDKPWYRCWEGMISRTTDGKKRCYDGIVVCVEWRDPRVFGEWAERNGFAPGLTIERKNPRSHYAPENCEWITKQENSSRSHITSPRHHDSKGRFARGVWKPA